MVYWLGCSREVTTVGLFRSSEDASYTPRLAIGTCMVRVGTVWLAVVLFHTCAYVPSQ